MGSFGGFYKGEKKKPKKGKEGKQITSERPTYTMPEVIIKKQKEQ
jgi:hypothetical protein